MEFSPFCGRRENFPWLYCGIRVACVAGQQRHFLQSILILKACIFPRASSIVADMLTACDSWWSADTAEELQRVWNSVGASGSANNWAFGYYRQGEALGACALEMVRKEAEHCDRLSGFLFFQSLSGGTGSGAGSRISELLRDEYPCSFMMHAAVWPSRRSEVVVQSYNAVLSLAHLLESTDALLALHNDEAHDICQRRLDIARPSLSHLNSVLAGCVAELWLPSSPLPFSATDPLPEPACPEMGDVVGTLCPSPLHKIVSVRSAPYISLSALPFSSHRWDGTLRTLRQMVSFSRCSFCVAGAALPCLVCACMLPRCCLSRASLRVCAYSCARRSSRGETERMPPVAL